MFLPSIFISRSASNDENSKEEVKQGVFDLKCAFAIETKMKVCILRREISKVIDSITMTILRFTMKSLFQGILLYPPF